MAFSGSRRQEVVFKVGWRKTGWLSQVTGGQARQEEVSDGGRDSGQSQEQDSELGHVTWVPGTP